MHRPRGPGLRGRGGEGRGAQERRQAVAPEPPPVDEERGGEPERHRPGPGQPGGVLAKHAVRDPHGAENGRGRNEQQARWAEQPVEWSRRDRKVRKVRDVEPAGPSKVEPPSERKVLSLRIEGG